MTENDTLPDRGGNTGRLMATPCATWKRRRARRPFSGGGDSGQHRAVKGEQNERPEPAAPAILSSCSLSKRLGGDFPTSPLLAAGISGMNRVSAGCLGVPFGPGCRAAQGAGTPSPPDGLPSVTRWARLQPAMPAPLFTVSRPGRGTLRSPRLVAVSAVFLPRCVSGEPSAGRSPAEGCS